ncbi:reprolysin-like metallopeptidase [Flavobacterium agrisoli]|uniref:T9SS type A sorting domain-containing protein n=1 Tax=Flavobacterium agrisoli TaxID=2793066 RepID=A0A934PJR5_9FLAO|nr:zinc-dependent metalloprotease family protein [Flavobacterium agrisoli]MBK0369432.1 T9SS type A sorting domain-containing protein [Flavobacterium agrisoli]
MYQKLLLFFAVFCACQIAAQEDLIWKKVNQIALTNKSINSQVSDELWYEFNANALETKLKALTETSATAKKTIVLSFPNTEGEFESFLVTKTSNFDEALQAKYPQIQSFYGIGTTDKNSQIYFSVSPIGIQTMTLKNSGNATFIEAIAQGEKIYRVFGSNTQNNGLVCTTDQGKTNNLSNQTAKVSSSAKQFKTVRLALSCTGEYAAYFGGTKAGALAGMNATLTRVNGIYNRDLAVQLILIANNDALLYTDASNDPYSNANQGVNGAWHLELQQTLTQTIGNDNYDMGHLFGASGGGGDAGCIGCICINPTSSSDGNAKGSAFTSPADDKPEGDTFDIDFVAHEMGHQLGANHTYSYDIEGLGVSVEPGSGSTIMGYAGITGDYDVQDNADDYFAFKSIEQIQNNLATKTCLGNVNITSNLPAVNAGEDYVIPKGTAFVLKGISNGSENPAVTYVWEQNDSAVTTSKAQSTAISTKVDGPLFRSVLPSATPIRYMPNAANVLAGKLTSTWESVATVARTLHFTLTARDNGSQGNAQTNTDEMVVTVNANMGPFEVTSQNGDNENWINGSQQTITWNVNNTNTLAGSSNVNIKISTDGGQNFDTLLVSNTPNDGSQTITVPAGIKGVDCRLLIEPTQNIFYAVNSKSFAIGYDVTTQTQTYAFAAPKEIPDGVANYTVLTFDVPKSDKEELIVDVAVNMNLTHTFLSDVDSYIENPQKSRLALFERSCENVNNTLDVSYNDSGTSLNCNLKTKQTVKPSATFAAFKNQEPQGTWSFGIRDQFVTDVGVLNSASLVLTTKVFTLANPEFSKDKFLIYSNPNNGSFMIEFSSDSIHEIQVLVYNESGSKVYEQKFEPTLNFVQNIQLVGASSGIYFVTVFDGNRKKTKKMIVN